MLLPKCNGFATSFINDIGYALSIRVHVLIVISEKDNETNSLNKKQKDYSVRKKIAMLLTTFKG